MIAQYNNPYKVYRYHVNNNSYLGRAASIASKYAGVESYINNEELGLSLYTKFKPHLSISRYLTLIESFKTTGYNPRYPLTLELTSNKNYPIVIKDGAHRLACSMYFNINVPCVLSLKKISMEDSIYQDDLYLEYVQHDKGFTSEEARLLVDTMIKLKEVSIS